MALITLLTDYGTSDSYVGEMKGTLARLAPAATVVDITHHVVPGDVRAARYLLGRTWGRFPSGTIHLAIVDPGVGTERACLTVATAGHYFLAPDNGLLTGIADRPDAVVIALHAAAGAAPTFHGRDLFAPAAAALAEGCSPADLGTSLGREPVVLELPQPHYEGKSVVGEVIYVDRYGNLVTNLTPAEVPSYAVLVVEDSDVGPLVATFGAVSSGAPLAYLGSGGQVEIAVRDGSAARRFGIGVGGKVRARLG
ncbi:MAG: S-adenosyl-l-methionine hydroxide adenosyltransferase family protein [Gemmatimonadales bacterium]